MKDAFVRLVEMAKMLRGENGCPWDKSRTLQNLDEDLIEEAHEVLEALKNNDDENLREELGDLLFNIVLMGVIAEQEGKFTLKEVIEDISDKIERRHTWVFGDDVANTPEEALAIWKENKEKEKNN